jgi:hypothetical protein
MESAGDRMTELDADPSTCVCTEIGCSVRTVKKLEKRAFTKLLDYRLRL